MKRIWKFPLKITDTQIIKMPIGAEILTVQTQERTPTLWALVNPDAGPEDRTIEIIGTDNRIDELIEERKYIGTFQEYVHQFVGHVFEIVAI